jgi:DNA-binding CsgD family transcriptional regulator
MDTQSSTIVGRDPELRDVSAFLDQIERGPRALVLEGSAGIGKTTLWSAGVRAAQTRGYCVLTARAAESEARLSYAALGDLLGWVSGDAFAGMPTPLRRAIDAALLRTDSDGVGPDQLAVSLATAHALRNLSANAALVLAIDDVQWLDRPSARVLSFALRRLSAEPIGALVSLRIAPDSPGDLLELDRAMPGTMHRAVGPLGPEPLGRILRDGTGAEVSRPVVTRLHGITGGNPLFALEMARAAVREGTLARHGDVWSVPEDLQKLLSARLAAMPQAARAPLLAIAATSQPTWDLVLEIAGPEERTLDALGRAEEAGIIERSGGRVRFTHPLLGSTLYVNTSAGERRALHARLASLATDLEERARHLALATHGPDEAVAVALEEASRQARARGAPDAAADLAALACEMTAAADSVGLRRRRLAAVEYLFDGGDDASARRLLKETIASSSPGHERAEMLYMLASMSWMDIVDGVRTPCVQALAEAGDDPRLLSGLHSDLAWVAFYLGDLAEAIERARESADWASRPVGAAARSDALASLAFIRFLRGEGDDAMLTEAIRLQDEALTEASWTTASVYTTPRTVLGLQLMWSYRLDEARAVFERELAEFERHSMYIVREEVLCYLTELECRAGHGSRAAEHGAEARSIFEESGHPRTLIHVVLFGQAWAAALLGRVDEARRTATEGLRLGSAADDRFNAALNSSVLGFIDVSLGDYERATLDLEPAMAYLDDLHAAVAGVMPCVPDLVEANVALGRIADAEGLIARLEGQASAGGGGWATATAQRGRALVAAAQGDLEEAGAAAERSTSSLEQLGLAFDAARSRLVLGQIHRRAKQKRLAREHLEGARDAFDRLGAVLWADRARSELARIGGRPPSPFALTDTETQIAALVARGRTNQETADALFVSPSTVQASLKRIYHKLGVRSRTELAAKVGQSPES